MTLFHILGLAIIATAVLFGAGCLVGKLLKHRRLRDTVFANLDSARSNGQFERGGYLHGAVPCEIAYDLITYAEDCENENPDDLLPHVKSWMERVQR